jgi:hypothetical protein
MYITDGPLLSPIARLVEVFQSLMGVPKRPVYPGLDSATWNLAAGCP